MQTFTANEAKVSFGAFLDAAHANRCASRGATARVVGALVSAQDYEAMRAFYANRLQHALAGAGTPAAWQGLTPGQLGDLLADES